MRFYSLNQEKRRKQGKLTVILLPVLLFFITGTIAYQYFTRNDEPLSENPAAIPGPITPTPLFIQATPTKSAAPEEDTVCNGIFNRGDSLYSLFREHGMEPAEIHRLAASLEGVFDTRRFKRGQPFRIIKDCVTGEFKSFTYEIDHETFLTVTRVQEKFTASVENYDFEFAEKRVSGIIETNLYSDAVQAGLCPALILDMADIFGWSIDFALDLRKKDTFSVIYEEKCREGQEPQAGNILAARFDNDGRSFYAFRYENGDQCAYYDEKGMSVQKKFLKSPLRYRYISSGYSYRRFHPILKRYRPHLGIDYAAASGTPVSALGDGRIIYAGWKGGFGNYIEIKHDSKFVTTYGHLRGFARGIRKGVRVKQGQVIGYVGSTGLSTGPHLDFRMKAHGKNVNPLKVKTPPSEPVPESEKERFFTLAEKYLTELEKG